MMARIKGGAFTMIELMVVIAIIALLATIAFPTFAKILSAGAEAQAYNLMASQIMSARALAISNGDYAALYCGLADPYSNQGLNRGAFYTQVMDYRLMRYNLPARAFWTATGYQPQRMPARIAFGRMDQGFVDAATGSFNGTSLAPAAPGELRLWTDPTYMFTQFGVIFSANGTVLTHIEPHIVTGKENFGLPVNYHGNAEGNLFFSPPFGNHGPESIFFHDQLQWPGGFGGTPVGLPADQRAGKKNLFDGWVGLADPTVAGGRPGVTAMVMFDFSKFELLDGANRATYLNENAMFLPINIHTGQLYPRP
jgi:prepilin-type N-terminal cleavage/methylation domain-containing protein